VAKLVIKGLRGLARSLHPDLKGQNSLVRVPIMKNAIWSFVAVAALATVGTTPAYASGTPAYCNIPIIGKYLCPPAPGGGGGGNSVPEPASFAVLAAGAGMVAAAVRRRRRARK
jgi:hypothetical protein